MGVEGFIREADVLLGMLDAELSASHRASGASDAELRFIHGLVQRMREAARTEALPPRTARTFGLGRHVVDHWTFRAGLGERLVGLEQWFTRLGVQGDA
jgi:hypothetical protein